MTNVLFTGFFAPNVRGYQALTYVSDISVGQCIIFFGVQNDVNKLPSVDDGCPSIHLFKLTRVAEDDYRPVRKITISDKGVLQRLHVGTILPDRVIKLPFLLAQDLSPIL